MKNKLMKKSMAVILALGVATVSFSGCGKKEIAFTTGLTKNELFKIDKTVCSMKSADVILLNLQREYTGLFGAGNWDREFAGSSIGAYVKQQAVKQLSQLTALSSLATKDGITLSKEEIDAVKNASDDYYNSAGDELLKKYDLEKSDVENVYKQYCLANKFYQKMIDSVDSEISDDEARIISLQYIFFSTKKTDDDGKQVSLSEEEKSDLNAKIASVVEKINAGEDFEKLAKENSDKQTITMNIGRDETEAAFEKAAFNLTDGQVSAPVETEDGIYIIKCISNYDEQATLENKDKIYEKRCNEALNNAYNDYISEALTEFNDDTWNNKSLESDDDVMNLPDLFGIYRNYLNQTEVVTEQ